MVRQFQRIIGEEARGQILEQEGRLPDHVVAAVGGGSNAIGVFTAFVEDKQVGLVGVEPGGKGLDTNMHGATLLKGRPGVLHGAYSMILQDSEGQISDTHSVSAGLDYPGVGPEHAHLKASNRARYVSVTDEEALNAFVALSKAEGIIPAFESAHAVAYAMKMAHESREKQVLIVNISGRGDKDMMSAQKLLKDQMLPVKFVGEERT
jgi:tryptophan synthase beta chain